VLAEGTGGGGGDKLFEGCAEAGEFADEIGAEEREGFARHKENRFEIGVEAAIGERELEFVLEIGDCAESSDEGDRFFLAGKFHEKSVKGGNFDLAGPGFGLDALLQELHPFCGGEGGVFEAICGHGDNDFIKKAYGAGEDIEMAEGDWVEGAWINGASHDQSIFTQRGKGGKEDFIFAEVSEGSRFSVSFDEAGAGGEIGVNEGPAKACGLGEGGDCFRLGGTAFEENNRGKGEGLGEESANEVETFGTSVEGEDRIVADFGFGLGNFF